MAMIFEKPSTRTRSRGLSSFNSEEDKDKETKKDSSEKKNSSEINSLFLERIYNESKKIEPGFKIYHYRDILKLS